MEEAFQICRTNIEWGANVSVSHGFYLETLLPTLTGMLEETGMADPSGLPETPTLSQLCLRHTQVSSLLPTFCWNICLPHAVQNSTEQKRSHRKPECLREVPTVWQKHKSSIRASALEQLSSKCGQSTPVHYSPLRNLLEKYILGLHPRSAKTLR